MISNQNKSILIFLVVLFLSFSFVSALEFEVKQEFAKGETLFAKVSGNFVDTISSQNVYLYQDHVRIAFVGFVKKINDEYYIYGQGVTKQEGNYSLRIQNVRYILSGETKSDEIIIPFKVSNKTAEFLVDPLVVASEGKFTVKIKNNVDKKIEVKSTFGKATSTTLLSYDETKEIEFGLTEQKEASVSKITLKSNDTEYTLLAFKITPPEISPGIIAQEGGASIKTEKIERIVYIEEGTKGGIFEITNPWKNELKNVEILVSESLKDYIIIKNQTVNLAPESDASILFEVKPGTTEINLSGKIIVKTSSAETLLPVSLTILESYIGGGEEKYNDCNDFFAGEICESDEICLGEVRDENETPVCCLGECQAEASKESINSELANKIVGWVLGLSLVLIIGWFILKKYKGAVRPIDLLKIGKGKPGTTKASIGKLEGVDKVGLEKEFEDNDLPSAIKSSLDSLSKKKK